MSRDSTAKNEELYTGGASGPWGSFDAAKTAYLASGINTTWKGLLDAVLDTTKNFDVAT